MAEISLVNIIFEDFVNYKKPSMTLLFPYCDFKCDRENGTNLCQNRALAKENFIKTEAKEIVRLYRENPITKSFVFQGLEPFDSWEELYNLIAHIRFSIPDDIVIYTGYAEFEIEDKIKELSKFPDIYIKFGRFVPNQDPHFDEVLGIELASLNQYGKKIS